MTELMFKPNLLIISWYNEYTTFKVDTRCLTEYIKETMPMSVEYISFVKNYMEQTDGKFFMH